MTNDQPPNDQQSPNVQPPSTVCLHGVDIGHWELGLGHLLVIVPHSGIGIWSFRCRRACDVLWRIASACDGLRLRRVRLPRMNARLTIISGDKAGDAFTLAAKARLVIGRSSQADVSLDSTDVSRLHCQVEGDGDLFWLTDLKSSNGTFVNDQPVTNYLLYDGDVISVGGVKLEFAVVQESGDGAETDRAVPAAPTPAPSAEADLPTLAVGQRVGGCEIQEKLARGAPFGVYKALHLSSHRTLTLKTLPRRLAASRALVQRLADDVQAARPLSHQNLVPTHLAGQDEGICFFGMEYVVGRGLQSVLLSEKKRTKLTVSRAMKIARHVGRALAHAHKNGVVHRAVAPRSIVISMEGLAHLGDFGLASALHSGSAGEIREMAAWLRTLPYVAPEVLRASSTVDQRADLY
ncbi:MAG: FHA domain-containing protein, partial [Planctomycetes bacterium]|nr:FHA domain-containing protein [Planctomycetota bacterium]